MDSAIESIFERIDEISRGVEFIVERLRLEPDVYTVLNIGKELKCSRSTLYKKRWLLPYFGESQYSGRPSRWDQEIWDSWKDLSENERRVVWEHPELKEDYIKRFEKRMTRITKLRMEDEWPT